MIEGMFSEKTTPAQREEIRTEMAGTPQQVRAFCDALYVRRGSAEAWGDVWLPVVAIVAPANARPGYEARCVRYFRISANSNSRKARAIF
jgi:hypothetical protein